MWTPFCVRAWTLSTKIQHTWPLYVLSSETHKHLSTEVLVTFNRLVLLIKLTFSLNFHYNNY
jgi:hypothetical protein